MTSPPIAGAESPALHVPFSLSLDVQRLDRSCRFYRELLGYEVVATERAGLIYETRTLRSSRYPGVELVLRGAFGRRVGGSQCGGMLGMSFRVDNLSAVEKGLSEPVRWVNADPSKRPGDDAGGVRLFDPDGYVIELRGAPATV